MEQPFLGGKSIHSPSQLQPNEMHMGRRALPGTPQYKWAASSSTPGTAIHRWNCIWPAGAAGIKWIEHGTAVPGWNRNPFTCAMQPS